MRGKTGFAAAIAAFLIVGLVAAGWLLKGSLEATARRALEAVASDMTGVPVALGALAFDFTLLEGGGIGLRIIKPDGFAGEAAFKFDQVTMELDPVRVLANPTVIDLMTINAPHIAHRLVASARQGAGDETGADPGGAGAQGLRARDFFIERLILRDGFLMISAPGFERDLRVAMPDLDLRDIDGDENKATPGEAIGQIVREALAEARQGASESDLAAAAAEIGESLSDLGAQLGEELKALGKAVGSAAEDTSKAIKEFFQDEEQQ